MGDIKAIFDKVAAALDKAWSCLAAAKWLNHPFDLTKKKLYSLVPFNTCII